MHQYLSISKSSINQINYPKINIGISINEFWSELQWNIGLFTAIFRPNSDILFSLYNFLLLPLSIMEKFYQDFTVCSSKLIKSNFIN